MRPLRRFGSTVWNERVYVVVAKMEYHNTYHFSGRVVRVLAVFTERERAEEFAGAQPKYYFRARNPKHLIHLTSLHRLDAEREYALGWRPCSIDQNDLNLAIYEWQELGFYISEVPWNPVLSVWPLDPESRDPMIKEP